MREELDLIEQYSVDEAFFRVDGNPNEVAERLKKAIETRVGIPVSIGISDTKTKAKYANSIAKTEGGVCVINDKLWSLFIPSLNLSKIWGVGNQMELRYKRHGLKTVGDFVALDRSRVVSLFGLNGLRLYEELGFNGVFELAAKAKPQQSILSSRSFETEIYDVEVLSDAVAFHVRQVAADLRKMDMETINIRVFLGTNRFGDFLLRGGSKEAILVTSTSDTLGLLGEANKLLEAIYESGVPYKKAGVSLSGLKPANRGQASLFTEYTAKEAPVLMGVIDALNFKADRELILIGSRLKNKVWRTRNYSASPSYTTEWKDIVRVKAD